MLYGQYHSLHHSCTTETAEASPSMRAGKTQQLESWLRICMHVCRAQLGCVDAVLAPALSAVRSANQQAEKHAGTHKVVQGQTCSTINWAHVLLWRATKSPHMPCGLQGPLLHAYGGKWKTGRRMLWGAQGSASAVASTHRTSLYASAGCCSWLSIAGVCSMHIKLAAAGALKSQASLVHERSALCMTIS